MLHSLREEQGEDVAERDGGHDAPLVVDAHADSLVVAEEAIEDGVERRLAGARRDASHSLATRHIKEAT